VLKYRKVLAAMHDIVVGKSLGHRATDHRGVGRWFGKGGLYRSIGKGNMISVYKIEPSYVSIRKHRGAPAPGAPMVPTPMDHHLSVSTRVLLLVS
jgi:hypothetical protein